MAFPRIEFSGKFVSLQITGVQLTGKILGKGSDATVKEVNWVGTSCAAKQLHEILLEDHSPGGAKRFVDNFEKECLTWSKLTHPHIVQFLGVYFLSGSRVPMLILEKMDTSLRHYLESQTSENFVLPDKIYILRQVAQALSYLHSCSPPLVHHDLSPNNILLNEVSLQAKVTDFGMTRAMDPSKMTRKSSVKGTQAFMSPEALVNPPKYDEKLDVFSYGNVIITTVTHKWPNPGPSTTYKGEKLVGISEFHRREQYLVLFTPMECEVFLPMVRSCLENRPIQRPTSIQLVTQMIEIEASHPRTIVGPSTIAQLRQERDQLRQERNHLRQVEARLHQEVDQLHSRFRVQQEEIANLKKPSFPVIEVWFEYMFYYDICEHYDCYSDHYYVHCVYVCVCYMCVYICGHVYTYVCTCMCIHIKFCVCMREHVCALMCVRVCAYVFVCVCVCVCV